MTVLEAADKLGLTCLALPRPDAPVDGAYTGDLLSWVMGNAREGNAWVTIMTNQNILAVASLINLSCVIVCEGSDVGDDVVSLAAEKDVNLLRTDAPAYAVCKALAQLGV